MFAVRFFIKTKQIQRNLSNFQSIVSDLIVYRFIGQLNRLIYTQVYIGICRYIQVYSVYIGIYCYAYSYIYIRLYIYIYIYICIYIYIYTRSYIHTFLYIYRKTKYEIFLQWNTKFFVQKVLGLVQFGSCQ